VPEVGERLISEILASIEALAEHPDIGRIVPEFGQAFLRELIRPPFRIVYRRDPKQVRIVRIWRSERLLELPGDDARR
jgi:toxin ParE1/3/4